MSINLQKGQRINLVKSGETLSKIMVGLGWDPVSNHSAKGFFSSLFGAGTKNVDCDASVFMLNENDSLKNGNIVYFGNLKSKCGSVQHTGDNLTGEGDGDDEVILVELPKVPKDIVKLVFVVNIYDSKERNQDFGMIKNAYIRVVNSGTKEEIIKYNLSEDYSGKTALIAGEIYRNGDEWKFAAIGEGTNDGSLTELSKRYRKK